MDRPRVGVSLGAFLRERSSPGRVRPPVREYHLPVAYVRAVVRAGGLPVLLPAPPGLGAGEAADWARELLPGLDGLLLSGGAIDLHPSFYGREPLDPSAPRDDDRSQLELALARAAMERGLPLLGVCGGAQLLAVAAGGALLQDLRRQRPGSLEHEQPTDPREPWHPVSLEPGLLRELCGAAPRVNSTHHQAVEDPGALRVLGRAPDGVIEAVGLPGHPFCLGVQWHPELLDGPAAAPYAGLVEAARHFHQRAR